MKSWFITVTTVVLLAQPAAAQVVSPGSTVAGQTIGEWIRDWVIWAHIEPAETNPLLDASGQFQHLNQDGPVYFIAGSFGETFSRSFTVPSDKYLLMPLIVSSVGSSSKDVDVVSAAADLADDHDSAFFSLSGISIPGDDLLANYREASGKFHIELQPPSLIDRENVVSAYTAWDGHWVMLNPLEPGEHVIHFGGGASSDNFFVDITANVTSVVPEPSGAMLLLSSVLLVPWTLRRFYAS